MILALTSALLVAASPARTAVVIGEDRGLGDEPRLSFAESDAALVATTLLEVGVVPRERLRLVQGGGVPAVLSAIEQAVSATGPDELLLVFYSGHGARDGLHAGGQVLSWRTLRERLEQARSRVVVAFIDACQSGAVLTAKGYQLGAPLTLHAEPLAPTGKVLVTSSGANELSYETRRLQGSPFAHAVASGLRGAADADGDGRVTLSELYRFTYAATLAATLDAPSGPQHAVQSSALTGAGEVVLAEREAGLVHLRRSSSGEDCYVVSADDTRVLAELPANASTVSLSPGDYQVKCVTPERLRVAKVELHGDVALESLVFQTRDPTSELAKGPGEVRGLSVLLGGAGGVTEDVPAFGAVAQVRFGGPNAAVFAEGMPMTSAGTVVTAGGLARLSWLDLSTTQLELGLSAGVALADTPRIALEEQVRLTWPLSPRTELGVGAHLVGRRGTSASQPIEYAGYLSVGVLLNE